MTQATKELTFMEINTEAGSHRTAWQAEEAEGLEAGRGQLDNLGQDFWNLLVILPLQLRECIATLEVPVRRGEREAGQHCPLHSLLKCQCWGQVATAASSSWCHLPSGITRDDLKFPRQSELWAFHCCGSGEESQLGCRGKRKFHRGGQV